MSEDTQDTQSLPATEQVPVPVELPPFNLGECLAKMMGEIHELSLAYRSLGRDPEAPFIDLIVTRLLKNDVFFEKLASAVVHVSKAMRSHHESQVTEQEATATPDKIIGAKITRLNEAPPVEEFPGEDGNTVKMTMNNHISIRSGFKEFEGATHTAIAGFSPDDSGEGRKVSSLIVMHKRYRQGLDITKGHGQALATTLNGGMKSLIENGKAEIDDFTNGKQVWFTIEETIYEGAPEEQTESVDPSPEVAGDSDV